LQAFPYRRAGVVLSLSIASGVDTAMSDARRLVDIRREQWHRACRGSLLACAGELNRPHDLLPHHTLVLRELEAVLRGETTRLLLLGPPGMGKTLLVSHFLPCWAMAYRPGIQIIAVSHNQQRAEHVSGEVRQLAQDHAAMLGFTLTSDARSYWATSNRSDYRAVGAGTGIRGYRSQLTLVDDPYASRAEAESETERDNKWSWFNSDVMSRPRETTDAVVVVATPYHQLDLLCRLQRDQPGEWKVLRLPAVSEGDDDPLGRPYGEPLAAGRSYGDLLLHRQHLFERTGMLHEWTSSYQGRPVAPEGNMFRPDRMPIFDALPALGETVRAWDLASSLKGDWTVGLKLARLRDWAHYRDTLAIVDVQRMRGPPEQVRHLVKTVAEADGYGVKIWLPLDPAQAGADQADSYVRMLSGFRVETQRMSGDKVTRADAAASQCNVGRIGLRRAPWNAALIDELGSFPSGQHDDQVDALSLAFSKLAPTSSVDVWARMADSYVEG
jgi:predicted phage terminase large subunit-like protein